MEHLNFDEINEKSKRRRKETKTKKEELQKQEEEEQLEIRQCEFDVLVQESFTKIILQKRIRIYCSIENEEYTSYIHSMQQKPSRNISKYELN